MEPDFLISAVLASAHPTQVLTASGHTLPREAVTRSLIELHLHLAEIYGLALDRATVARGVRAILEDPALGRVTLAWRPVDACVLGQVEIKTPFEVWHNSRYWYIDNHVVFPSSQQRSIGTALVEHVKDEARRNGVACLRLYVGLTNERARRYYKGLGFEAVGDLLESPVGD